YRRALQQEPTHYWSHFQAGRCLLALGRPEEAIAELGACIALRPGQPWAYSARGLALTLTRQLDAARADLDRAVALRPDFRPALLNRGLLRRLQHDRDAALRDFDAALAPPPTGRLIEAAYYRAQLFLEEGDYPSAVQDLNLVESERPNLVELYPLRMRAR